MMVNSLKAIVEKIENNKQISFGVVFLLIYIASFLRGFLENYANFDNQNHIMGVIDTFFHYPFWFFGIFISTSIILALFTRERIEKIGRLGVISSFMVVLPPILDLIIRGGAQTRYSFIVGTFSDLATSFLTFFGSVAGGTHGATIGMKMEIILVMLAIGFYIFNKTKKFLRAVAGVLALYTTIFIFISSPTFIFAAKNAFSVDRQEINYQTINNFYSRQELTDSFTKDRTFIVENNNDLSVAQSANNIYSITLSVIFLIADILLLAWWLWLYDAKKFAAVIKNFRFLRIAHYFLMVFAGIYFGMKFSGQGPITSLFDFVSFISLFGCLLLSWLFSVWDNDEADVEIDKISNSERPLAKNILTLEEWRISKYLFLFIALSFAFLGGLYLFILTLLFLSIYYIYSIPPLRLKRFFGVSSLLVAFNNGLTPVLMGFFLSSGTENLQKFPGRYFWGILIIFFLVEHAKNLKDFEGDKKAGTQTLPVMLGLKNAKLASGILVFFAALLVPIFFYFNVVTFITAVFFGMMMFFAINKEKFKEKYVFIIYFIFAAVFAGEMLLSAAADSFDARASQAATAGWHWLYQYNNNFSDPGIPMIIKTINDKYCHSPKAENFWKNILKEFENHPYLPVFERFTSDKMDYKKISDKALAILKTPQIYYNDVLPQALYCDLYPVREDFAVKTFDKIETETGYDLTHKFWSAVLFKENGCIAEGYNLNEIISTAAQKMVADQEANGEINDLYAERTAFLEYYGFKNLVKESWIKNIMDNQLESGAWINSVKGVGNPHTTALSIWALAEHSATCPFQ